MCIISSCCDLDLEDSEPIFLQDTPSYDNTTIPSFITNSWVQLQVILSRKKLDRWTKWFHYNRGWRRYKKDGLHAWVFIILLYFLPITHTVSQTFNDIKEKLAQLQDSLLLQVSNFFSKFDYPDNMRPVGLYITYSMWLKKLVLPAKSNSSIQTKTLPILPLLLYKNSCRQTNFHYFEKNCRR